MTLANGAATAQAPRFDSESFNDKVIDHVHSVEISMKWWAILQHLIPLGSGFCAPQQIISTGRRFSFIFLNEQNWGLMVATSLDLLLLWPAQAPALPQAQSHGNAFNYSFLWTDTQAHQRAWPEVKMSDLLMQGWLFLVWALPLSSTCYHIQAATKPLITTTLKSSGLCASICFCGLGVFLWFVASNQLHLKADF